jgi:Flp pilus assembly protein TadD
MPELELQLSQHGDDVYVGATLRADRSARLTDITTGKIRIDVAELLASSLHNQTYGERLGQVLLGDGALRDIWVKAKGYAGEGELRVRLRCDPGAGWLHGLRWELLRDPYRGGPIARMPQVYFSRMLAAREAAPVPLRSREALRAVALVANPDGLTDYGLPAIDVDAELDRAREALDGFPLTALGTGHGATHATLNTLFDNLRGGVAICYIVAHGGRAQEDRSLLIESEVGTVHHVTAQEFATRIGELPEKPRLIVLAACRSAGASHDSAALQTFGPLLIAAGVPAVIVMQDNVPIDVVRRMMPTFFRELYAHGIVDRAMALARSTLGEDEPWWHPVLFMQLDDGRLWQEEAHDPGRRLMQTGWRWAGAGLVIVVVAALLRKLLAAGIDSTIAASSGGLVLASAACLALLTPAAQRWLSRRTGRIPPRPRSVILPAAPALLALLIALGVALALPGLARTYADQGFEVLRQDRPAEALTLLNRAVALDPCNAIAHYHRGIAQEKLTQADEAKISYRHAFECDPNLSAAYNNLAHLLLRAGDYSAALTLLQQVARPNPQDSLASYALYKNLGWADLEAGNYTQAEADLQRALSYNPDGPAAHCLLAQTLEERPAPDPAHAREEWAACLRYEFSGEHVEPEWLNRAHERLNGGGN